MLLASGVLRFKCIPAEAAFGHLAGFVFFLAIPLFESRSYSFPVLQN